MANMHVLSQYWALLFFPGSLLLISATNGMTDDR